MIAATARGDSARRRKSTVKRFGRRRLALLSTIALASLCRLSPRAHAQCAPTENAQLGPALSATTTYYGGSVVINGARALVGSNGDYFGHGSCYVYDRATDGTWTTSAVLTASDGVFGDVFGSSTAMSGERAIVGAYLRWEEARASGAAYVFDHGGGSWVQAVKLLPDDGAQTDWFGLAVGISGATAAVGAPYADVGYSRSGAVYVFDRNQTGVWSQSAKLSISEPSGVANYILGWAVAIDGDTLMAGAPGYAFAGQIFIPGYVYVFERSGGAWTQRARLMSSDGAIYDTFGSAIALDGSTLLVGSPLDDDACPSDPACQSGSAYVFERIGGAWTQTAKLVAPDALAGDLFGSSVALSGDLAVIGAPGVDERGASAGAMYVYQRVGGVWTFVARQQGGTVTAGDGFGSAVAAGSGAVLCAAPQHSNTPSLEHAGAVYSFLQSNNAPAAIQSGPQDAIVEEGGTTQFSVVASGTAPLTYHWQKNGVDLNDGPHVSGSATATLTLSGVTYPDAGLYRVVVQNLCSSATSAAKSLVVTCALPSQLAKLAPSTTASTLHGAAVAMRGSRAIVGAYGDSQNGSLAGAAWIYDLAGGVWQTTVKLTPKDGSAGPNDEFGWSVALDGDVAVVGARYDQTGFNYNAGTAFVFERIGGVWTQTARLVATDGTALEEFGAVVAVSGTTIAVTSRMDGQNGEAAGSVYIFEKTGSTWSQTAKILPADAGYHDYFGSALALSGDVLIAGTPGDSDIQNDAGSVYVFERSGGAWSQSARLTSPVVTAYENFGSAVAVDGLSAFIGVPADSTLGNQAGAVYVVNRVAGVWQIVGKLTAVGGAAGDWFGNAVAMSGDTAVIGAEFEDQQGMNAGAAYVFQRLNGNWTQAAKLVSTDAAAFDDLGHAVAIGSAAILLGAPQADAPLANAGAAYVFELPGVPPSIVNSPLLQLVAPGATAVFSVTASGSPPVYQWRHNSVNLADGGRISGCHTSQLSIANVGSADAGAYDVVVTNDCGAVVSAPATLIISSTCFGDLNGDQVVDLADLSILLGNYGNTGTTYPQGDLNQDGIIDLFDLSSLLSHFGNPCS